VQNWRGRFLSWGRRWLDLQAGSIWQDLRQLLSGCCGVVVDVGCGAQPYRSLLPREASYVGIDTIEARAHFGYHLPGTLYFEGDVWPVANESVDLVLATETLEHIADPGLFLREAHRCLKPGGQLILTVPFAARWHFIPFDYWRFTPSGLQRLLGAEGFENLAVYARGNEVTVACYKVMSLLLPLLFTPSPRGAVLTVLRRLLGCILAPFLLLLALVGNWSLRGGGGNDCLGYTAVATRQRGTRTP